jgi:hypothetical protein
MSISTIHLPPGAGKTQAASSILPRPSGQKMTVAELINQVLDLIFQQFECYQELRVRDFMRDRPALMKAVARLGYTCEQNGWQLDVQECKQVLMAVLQDLKLRQDRINYLPIYLEGAVKRHLGQKAEEYSARQKSRGSNRQTAVIARESLDGVTVVTAVKEKTATETLSELYVQLKKCRRKKSPAPAKQQTLL